MGPQILLAGPAGGAPGAPMIRERTIDGEPILSIDTMEEFSQAVATGQPIEMPWALARSLGCPILPEAPVDSLEEVQAAAQDPCEW